MCSLSPLATWVCGEPTRSFCRGVRAAEAQGPALRRECGLPPIFARCACAGWATAAPGRAPAHKECHEHHLSGIQDAERPRGAFTGLPRAVDERDHGRDHSLRRAAGAQVRQIGAELSALGVWVFNGDYRDLAQIIAFIGSLLDDLRTHQGRGRVPVQLLLRGRIPWP